MLVLSLVESNDGGVHQSVGYLAEITFFPSYFLDNKFKYLFLNTKKQKTFEQSNQLDSFSRPAFTI